MFRIRVKSISFILSPSPDFILMKHRFKELLIFLIFFWGVWPLSAVAQEMMLEGWTFRNSRDGKWMPASVPGLVHTDLLRNGLIPDPYKNDNEKKLQWIGEVDWEYRCEFSCADEFLKSPQLELVFEGLDTYAKVYLNDSLILSADNMFRSWTVDVRKLLGKRNSMLIKFSAVEKEAGILALKLPYALPEGLRSFTRKAQYHYGWDWGPRFLTCGIWKPVKLLARGECALLSIRITKNAGSRDHRSGIAHVKVKSLVSGKKELLLFTADSSFRLLHEVNIRPGLQTVTIPFTFPQAERWYPAGKGKQALYRFNCAVAGTTANIISCNAGFGAIALHRENDERGESFGFRVNGQALFAKGANVIPPEMFLPEVPDSVYELLVIKARDAGMNMLRVWGGGVYFPDAFYNYCDKYGIMVWQDFMFACSMVPGDDAFIENVRREAVEQTERLSGHPCIALWCGNNESDEGWHNWGWQKQLKYSADDSSRIWSDYRKVFHSVLPAVIDSLDPGRDYLPSSPVYGWGREESMTHGDSHYWGIWWGMEDFETYKVKTGRFMSEYGFQSLPDISLWKGILDTLSLGAAGFRNHQKHPRGFETIDNYLSRYFSKPADLSDYSYVSQLQQVYGMKMAMRSHRMAYPHCMGSLFWQLNDCWPAVSWSALDSRENEKLFYFEAKRNFDSLFIASDMTTKGLYAGIHNDGTVEKSVTLRLYFIRTDTLLPPVLIDEKRLHLPPDSMIKEGLFFPEYSMRNLDTRAVIFVTEAEDNFTFKILRRDYIHRCRPGNLRLQPATVLLRRLDAQTVEVSADVFTYSVYLYDEEGLCRFSDNGFHLLPGERRVVDYSGDFSKIRWKCYNNVPR